MRLSLPRSKNEHQVIVREAWWNARGGEGKGYPQSLHSKKTGISPTGRATRPEHRLCLIYLPDLWQAIGYWYIRYSFTTLTYALICTTLMWLPLRMSDHSQSLLPWYQVYKDPKEKQGLALRQQSPSRLHNEINELTTKALTLMLSSFKWYKSFKTGNAC